MVSSTLMQCLLPDLNAFLKQRRRRRREVSSTAPPGQALSPGGCAVSFQSFTLAQACHSKRVCCTLANRCVITVITTEGRGVTTAQW